MSSTACPACLLNDRPGRASAGAGVDEPARGPGRYKGEITPSPAECGSIRRRLGWRQERLAAEAGLTEKTVRDFESGVRTPHPRTLIAIRRAFRAAGAQPAQLSSAPLRDAQ